MYQKVKKLFFLSLCFSVLLSGVYVYGGQKGDIDQTTRLAALAKVWGLLKYYHPEVGKGEIDWDAALVSAIPAVKAAEDFESFNQEIDNLILQAGDIINTDYNPNAPAHPNEQLFKWLKDKSVFSPEVSNKLKWVQKKHIPADNYYVETQWEGGNTYFPNEKEYNDTYYPDENYRLLGLFRYWNVIQYFFPYKDDIGEDWEEILEEFIPPIMTAADSSDYHLGMLRLSTRIRDGHAFCNSAVLSYYFGYYNAPFETRYIEDKTVVTRVFSGLMTNEDDVKVGDVILKVDGKDIDAFRNDVAKYAFGANEPNVQKRINDYVQRGRNSQLNYTLLQGGQVKDVTVPGYYGYIIAQEKQAEDSALEKWKLLPGNIGYVHLGILGLYDVVPAMMELMGTRAIIFDLRVYPEFTLYLLGYLLNPTATPFCLIHHPVLDYPGEFAFRGPLEVGVGFPAYYNGKVVVLVNEQTMSRGEFYCMALQTAPDATVIGSQTAGSDGNISIIPIPGKLSMYFSGLGIYYPDKSPTQQIGIVPDIQCHATVSGIGQGRDELMERAIAFIENN